MAAEDAQVGLFDLSALTIDEPSALYPELSISVCGTFDLEVGAVGRAAHRIQQRQLSSIHLQAVQTPMQNMFPAMRADIVPLVVPVRKYGYVES